MEQSVVKVIEECARSAQAGTGSFPDTVRALLEVGIEAYHADYRRRTITYYSSSNEAHSVELRTPSVAIPDAFDAAQVADAIKASQRGELKYPRFLEVSMAAGCVGYVAWLSGRKVTYFGRRGEEHVEKFPGSP